MTSLVVAIEADREQAARLSDVVRYRVEAELVLADSAAAALSALGDRVPDLILTPPLLSARDEATVAERLRKLGPSAAHVQTITVPRFGMAPPVRKSGGGLLGRFRRAPRDETTPESAEAESFAQQITDYLRRAQTERIVAPVAPPAEIAVPDDIAVIDEIAVTDEIALPDDVWSSLGIAESEPPVQAMAEPAELQAIQPEPGLEQMAGEPSVFQPFEPDPLPEPVAVDAVLEAIEPEPISLADPRAVHEVVDPAASLAVEDGDAAQREFASVLRARGTELLKSAWASLTARRELFDHGSHPDQALEAVTAEPVGPSPAVATPELPTPELTITVEEFEFEAIETDEPFVIPKETFDDIDVSALLDALAAEGDERPEADPVRVVEPASVVQSLAENRPAAPPVTPNADPVSPKATRAPRPQPPVQDEWGVFDPEQCGFAALLAKLDEVAEEDEGAQRAPSTARVISVT